MEFFGMGFGEILVVLVIAVIIFGPGKVIELSRSLGKMLNNVRKTTSELTAEVTREIEEQKRDQPSQIKDKPIPGS